MMQGQNGDLCYTSTKNALVDFFAKAGSFSKSKKSHYNTEFVDLVELFQKAWETDNYKAMQLAMWTRDIRGGAGSRKTFRDILSWLAISQPKWILANLKMIPQVGRWDDLLSLHTNTECEQKALEYWVSEIIKGNKLAGKWAPRQRGDSYTFNKMRKIAKMSPKEYRKLLVQNTNVIETLMCENKWNYIDFNHVPSVAMSRLASAFSKNDYNRFEGWKKSLSDPKSNNKVNASTLYPHDCIKTMLRESSELANAQFDALPDYINNKKTRIICLADFSGSMTDEVSDGIRAMDVSLGLSLYCSEKIGKDNPFYRKFIPFSDDSALVDWKKETFSEAAIKHNNGYCGGTNIQGALEKILDCAKFFNLDKEQMPNCLLILSDMQFNEGSYSDETAIEEGMRQWDEAGYPRPQIVYWNLAKYEGFASDIDHEQVVMVSGFSPSILKPILDGEDFSPMGIMERTIAKYEVVRPL